MQLDRQMVSVPRRAIHKGSASRPPSDLDQLGERTGAEARMHGDQAGRRGDQADRVEILRGS